MEMILKGQRLHVSLAFIALYTSTVFVNKYVLSELKFTYPTIFQGWQTLVGAIVLRALSLTGYISIDFSQFQRSSLLPWLPGMVLYVLSIYSGSVALSKISVPVFLCIQNVFIPIAMLSEKVKQKQGFPFEKHILFAMILVSSFLVAWNDPKFLKKPYLWMSFHIVSTGLYFVYENASENYIKIGNIEKSFCNYIFSVIVLAPCSYLLGDVFQATNFEFLYFYKFYVGCVCSGMFGVLVTVISVKLRDSKSTESDLTLITGVAKIVASALSLPLFKFTLTAGSVFWVLVNLSLALFVGDWETSPSIPAGHQRRPSYGKPSPLQNL